jgi:dTMP kinase
MKKHRGTFIVLEGLDGSGTTTQAKKLHHYFQAKKIKSILTCEPTDNAIGKLIRDMLTGKLYSPDSNRKIAPSEKALCLLFAADRLEHSKDIELFLEKGHHVICDRYVLSSLAYQSLDEEISTRWITEVNAGCSTPDITVLLKVTPDECTKRIKSRKNVRTIYEKRNILRAIDDNYNRMLPTYRKHYGPVVKIDGAGSPVEIHDQIVKNLAKRFALTR